MSATNEQNSNWDWEPNESPRDRWVEISYTQREFEGKNLDYAIMQLKTSPLMLSEALSFMPKEPFRYFVKAYKAVFLSDKELAELKAEYEAPNAAGSYSKSPWALISERALI